MLNSLTSVWPRRVLLVTELTSLLKSWVLKDMQLLNMLQLVCFVVDNAFTSLLTFIVDVGSVTLTRDKRRKH